MKIKRISIQQFRRFNQPVLFENLASGLNIFAGPNESGKSTIAQAIRVAFLERYNTNALQELRPWGDSSAAPQVDIDFQHNGKYYQLSKRFFARKMCRLNIDGDVIDGDEAESYLSNLLGYSQPSRGASQEKYWGIPGLLWVDQGRGHELLSSVQHANKSLHEVLNTAVEQIGSYDGDLVLEKVKQNLLQLLTFSTRQPTKEYKKSIDTQKQLQQQLTELNASIDLYKKQVDRLGELRESYQKNEMAKPWEQFKKQELEARKLLQKVEQLRLQSQNINARLQTSINTQKLLQDQIDTLNEQKQVWVNRQIDLSSAQDALKTANSQTQILQKQKNLAQENFETIHKKLEKLQDLNNLYHKNNQLLPLNNRLSQLKQQLQDAIKLKEELIEKQRLAQNLFIEPQLLQNAKKLDLQAKELLVQHNATATKLRVSLKSDKNLLLNNKVVNQDLNQLISVTTTIEVPGIASIVITPGGTDLPDLANTLHQTKRDLQHVLAQAKVKTPEDLWQKQAQHISAMDRIKHVQELILIHAPKGIEKISDEINELQIEVDQIKCEIDSGLKQYNLDLEGLANMNVEYDLQAAQKQLLDAQKYLQIATLEQQEHNLKLTKLQTRLESANTEFERARMMNENHIKQNIYKQTLQSLNTEIATHTQLKEQLKQIDSEIQFCTPSLLEQDIQRFKTSAKNALDMQAQTNLEIIEITASLRALGAQGIEEKAFDLQNELMFVDKQVQQYQKTADNLSMLFDLLMEKKQDLILKLHQPLIARMQTYLQVMFQQDIDICHIKLDENLVPSTILRHNINAPIVDLSFGAKEQIGIISRLAYADLLKESGKPTLILLDDALLHSDDVRLQQAKRILYDAASKHQILLFTCQPDKWRDMAVIPRFLN